MKNNTNIKERKMEIRPIRGFEGYGISDTGIVFNRHGRRLALKLDHWGYHRVNLSLNGRSTTKKIHQLVLSTFIGVCPDGKQCNHKNGIKTDNNFKNLEWVTPSENMIHAFKNGLMHRNSVKLKPGEVWLIKRILKINILTQEAISKMFNVSQSIISKIKLGKIGAGWG